MLRGQYKDLYKFISLGMVDQSLKGEGEQEELEGCLRNQDLGIFYLGFCKDHRWFLIAKCKN